MITLEIEKIIQNALDEDLGSGDVTTDWIIPKETRLTGTLVAKAEGIIAGLEIFTAAFRMLDENIQIDQMVNDGDEVSKGKLIARVDGAGRAILSAERVALNFLQRMSGIATYTNKLVKAVEGTKAVILDTRKTAPGLRMLDKMAVRIGGGKNHRIGLYDMVLIKDNHISAAGGISEAVAKIKSKNKAGLLIEVEVKNRSELKEAINVKADRILLDNMSLETIRDAVKITGGLIPLEASGNVTEENIREIASTGVDYISSGMLTHSVKALDISFLIED